MLKRLAMSGVAVAALFMATGSSFAADIIQEAVVEEQSNWYVSLHGGYKFSEDWDDTIDLGQPTGIIEAFLEGGAIFGHNLGANTVEADAVFETDSGIRVGGALGYQWLSWLAVEGELGYMWQDFTSYHVGDIREINAGGQVVDTEPCDVALCSGDLGGDVGILTGMINAIVGIPIAGIIRPYIGAGVGVAHVNFGDISGAGLDLLDDSDTTFAYQGFVGVDVGITEKVALGIRGRAVNVGDVELEDDFGFSHNFNPDWIKSVEAVLTFAF